MRGLEALRERRASDAGVAPHAPANYVMWVSGGTATPVFVGQRVDDRSDRFDGLGAPIPEVVGGGW